MVVIGRADSKEDQFHSFRKIQIDIEFLRNWGLKWGEGGKFRLGYFVALVRNEVTCAGSSADARQLVTEDEEFREIPEGTVSCRASVAANRRTVPREDRY